jgi:hypothetical protein
MTIPSLSPGVRLSRSKELALGSHLHPHSGPGNDTIAPFHLVVDPHQYSLFRWNVKWRGRLDDVRLVLTTSLMWYFGFSPIDDRNDRMSFDMTNYAIFFLSLSLRV